MSISQLLSSMLFLFIPAIGFADIQLSPGSKVVHNGETITCQSSGAALRYYCKCFEQEYNDGGWNAIGYFLNYLSFDPSSGQEKLVRNIEIFKGSSDEIRRQCEHAIRKNPACN